MAIENHKIALSLDPGVTTGFALAELGPTLRVLRVGKFYVETEPKKSGIYLPPPSGEKYRLGPWTIDRALEYILKYVLVDKLVPVRPFAAVMEAPSFYYHEFTHGEGQGKNLKAIETNAEIGQLLEAGLFRAGVPFFKVYPKQWKGSKSKNKTLDEVHLLLRGSGFDNDEIYSISDHEADAVKLLYHFWNRRYWERRTVREVVRYRPIKRKGNKPAVKK